jgi:hypothetical protein
VTQPDAEKIKGRVLSIDEEILKELVHSKERDLSRMHSLSHVPEPPITTQKLQKQLSKLRAYKCTSVLYCVHCSKFRFIRSHHCSQLGVCVSRMDHYCAFLDNCIGKKNHRYFVQYLTYTYLTLAWVCFELLWCDQWLREFDASPPRAIMLNCTL